MTRRTWWARKHWHPSERDLLLFVNGEGSTALARSVRDHLDGCWSCSLKRDQMAGAIAAFMRERESGLATEEPSDSADRKFNSKLRRAAQQAEIARAASKRSPSERWLLGVPLPVVVAVSLMAVLTAFVWLRFGSVPSVSAREILNRAEHAEAGRIRAVTEPVIHQRFQITRLTNGQSPQSTNLEIWHDWKNNRWRQETEEAAAVSGVVTSKATASRNKSRPGTGTADHPVIQELQSVQKSNDLHQNPISVSAFAAWRSKLKNPVERIAETRLESGAKALTITTTATEPVANSRITKAEFVVRRQDWHPVEQRLNVSEPDGFRSYEIRETSFEVVALGSIGASIFELPELPAPLALQTASPDRPPLSVTPVNALELEMTLVHLLHQAGACLGEEVHIVEGVAGRLLELRGVVESSERKQELIRLFSEFPDVPVLLQVPGGDEMSGSTAGAGMLAAPAAAETTQGDHGPAPMKDHLLAHFAMLDLPREAQRARMVEFSNLVISQSQSAHSHVWALRRLVERFQKEQLSASALARFQSMAQDHLRELSILIGRSDEMLRPVLGSLSGSENAASRTAAGAVQGEGTLPSVSMRLFESVIHADNLILALLVGTDVAPNLRESGSALLAALPKIQEDIRAVDSQLSGLVSAASPPAISARSIQQRVP